MRFLTVCLLLSVLLPISLVQAKDDKITPVLTDRSGMKIQEYCINGHAFVIVLARKGVSIVQVYEGKKGSGFIPQPKTCGNH